MNQTALCWISTICLSNVNQGSNEYQPRSWPWISLEGINQHLTVGAMSTHDPILLYTIPSFCLLMKNYSLHLSPTINNPSPPKYSTPKQNRIDSDSIIMCFYRFSVRQWEPSQFFPVQSSSFIMQPTTKQRIYSSWETLSWIRSVQIFFFSKCVLYSVAKILTYSNILNMIDHVWPQYTRYLLHISFSSNLKLKRKRWSKIM